MAEDPSAPESAGIRSGELVQQGEEFVQEDDVFAKFETLANVFTRALIESTRVEESEKTKRFSLEETEKTKRLQIETSNTASITTLALWCAVFIAAFLLVIAGVAIFLGESRLVETIIVGVFGLFGGFGFSKVGQSSKS